MNTDTTPSTVKAAELRSTLAKVALQFRSPEIQPREIHTKFGTLTMVGPPFNTLDRNTQESLLSSLAEDFPTEDALPELRAALLEESPLTRDSSEEEDLNPTVESALLKSLKQPSADVSAKLVEIERKSQKTLASPADQRNILYSACIETVLQLCSPLNSGEPPVIPFRGELPRISKDSGTNGVRGSNAEESASQLFKGIVQTSYPLHARFRAIQEISLRTLISVATNAVWEICENVHEANKEIGGVRSKLFSEDSLSANREDLMRFIRDEAQKAFEQDERQKHSNEAQSQAQAADATLPSSVDASAINERVVQFVTQNADKIDSLHERNVQLLAKAKSLSEENHNRFTEISNLTKGDIKRVSLHELQAVFDGLSDRVDMILNSDHPISLPASFVAQLAEENPVTRLLAIQDGVYTAARNIRSQSQERDGSEGRSAAFS
ncbi:MAG TPA: hypothetical protein VGZ00_06255 [Candidatus Baltobacteraceae bacterium]|jgi:hypothetical protein|nr:hypothetical protein [Candidatus Baltobacteraceae bacterium]